MQQPTGQSEPRYLEYTEIIEYPEYVTGIALLDNLEGPGVFEIRVSGQKDRVLRYSKETIVHELALRFMDPDALKDSLEERRQSVLALRRAYWHDWLQARCKALHGMIEEVDLPLLADRRKLSERFCQELASFDEDIPPEKPHVDLSKDRLIEIKYVVDEDPPYLWSWVFTSVVLAGTSDWYLPNDPTISAASATITSEFGNADLYLYRGGGLENWSTSTGPVDSVYAWTGVGNWELEVRGVETAQYTKPASWYKI